MGKFKWSYKMVSNCPSTKLSFVSEDQACFVVASLGTFKSFHFTYIYIQAVQRNPGAKSTLKCNSSEFASPTSSKNGLERLWKKISSIESMYQLGIAKSFDSEKVYCFEREKFLNVVAFI